MSVSISDISADLRSVVDERPKLSVKEVINKYHHSLLSFLRQRVRISENAADVAQETYVRMLQYEGSREIQSPSSLLFKIAINVANDLGRAEQVRHIGEQCSLDDLELESDQATPEREIAAAQELDHLYDVIEKLPPKCKRVFILSRMHCMTYPQIAKHCGISVKMVEKHISHALAVCMESVDAE
ncbi:MAG TPA: RNA polymerase sigma factor [Steroidobacteraceae bacterium]|jgi:RNA polymerase sigma-70 factor (ECF subfamily)|nr:RNA polymerase sigma factor [Steroidobacteraceae bacterium]